MSRHVDLDFADKLLEEPGAIARWRSERFVDGPPQHLIGRGGEYARLEIRVFDHDLSFLCLFVAKIG